MRPLYLALLLAAGCSGEELPLTGISHVNFRVSDLEKARAFYEGILGLQEAFHSADQNGNVRTTSLKVNDEQFIEISPGLPPGSDPRLTHISFVTTGIEKLHGMLTERGLKPTALRPPGGDGTRGIRITDPFGFPLEFTEYLQNSWHAQARGKFEASTRVSKHMLHAGIPIPRAKLDEALVFYRDQLGFTEFWRGGPEPGELAWINLRTPGSRGDYIELMLHDGSPTHERLGSMQHACLEVPDIQAAYKLVLERGVTGDRSKPRIGRNGKRQLNLFDPDGTRTELMEPKVAAEK